MVRSRVEASTSTLGAAQYVRALGTDRGARTEVDALLRAAATLETDAGVDELLRTLVEQAAGLLNVERARFIVGSAEQFGSNMLWRSGTWIEDLYEGRPGSAGGHVWRTRRPYRSDNPAQDPRTNQARLISNNVRSLLVVPLLGDRKEVLGLLSVANSRHPDGFSQHDERLLSAFCRFASVIVARARGLAARSTAEQDAARRRREVEALLAAADQLNDAIEPKDVLLRVVAVAAELLAVERANIITNEGNHGLIRHSWAGGVWQDEDIRLPLDSSICGWVITHAMPYRTDDMDADPLVYRHGGGGHHHKRVLSVPIAARDGQVLGVLGLFERLDGAPFSDEDVRLAEGIAHHAAVALERATLTDALQRSTRTVALLEERERIAMDLHDGAIQSLYGVMLGLEAYLRSPGTSGQKSPAVLRDTIAQIDGVIQEIRTYITGLYSREPAAVSLASGLGAIVEELRANTQIQVELDLSGAGCMLDSEAAANVLQIAREATSNVARHAHAITTVIRLRRHTGGLTLTVKDDGRGFDAGLQSSSAGHGLRNMAERARILGADLSIVSEPGRGTELRLLLPLTETGVAQ